MKQLSGEKAILSLLPHCPIFRTLPMRLLSQIIQFCRPYSKEQGTGTRQPAGASPYWHHRRGRQFHRPRAILKLSLWQAMDPFWQTPNIPKQDACVLVRTAN